MLALAELRRPEQTLVALRSVRQGGRGARSCRRKPSADDGRQPQGRRALWAKWGSAVI